MIVALVEPKSCFIAVNDARRFAVLENQVEWNAS
jgi:hypothetical protein